MSAHAPHTPGHERSPAAGLTSHGHGIGCPVSSEPASGASVFEGTPHDWSGAWVRATAPLPTGKEGPEVVSAFLAEHGGVTVVYEPILDIRQSHTRLLALETVVKGPAGSPHEDPAHFSEFFRCRGHLATLDAYSLEAALADAASLPFTGSVVLNVEAVTVAAPGFDERLLGLARRWDLDPSRLILDVRLGYEEAPTGRLGSGVLKTRTSGVRVCFDEMRSSASPLLLLELATPDFVKLSRNTVRNLWRDPWTRQCVEAALRLGEDLCFQVIAQGVASDRDLEAVKSCGIGFFQGSLLGPARTASELAAPGHLLGGEAAPAGPAAGDVDGERAAAEAGR